MDNKRNRTQELISYIKSFGIEVNIGKNKARGNKGFFSAGKKFRIDIAKGQENITGVLLHEFAHYIHYVYDSTLSSLEFFFGDINDDLINEMIEITVARIPKRSIEPMFVMADELRKEIKELADSIKNEYKDFKISRPCLQLEKKLSFPLNLLLKYDRVKTGTGEFSTETIERDFPFLERCCAEYLILKSKQRYLKRITSSIARLNKYYNSPSELFARCFEVYYTDRALLANKAPRIFNVFNEAILNNKFFELSGLNNLFL